MKKLILLSLAISLLIVLDGFLIHDIFDRELLSPVGWTILLLAIVLFGIILLADSTTKNAHPETPKGNIHNEKDA